jgi:putative colanic acid biosynthesis acetyltransferase WcaF
MTIEIRNLAAYDNSRYDPGRGFVVRTIWYFVSLWIFESGWFPVSGVKAAILRWFGARIGKGLVIRPHVRIKYPWKLTVGDHCWIGQQVWIDNLENVIVGSHVCISQAAYLCTGSHNHRSPTFELIVKPILIGDGAWLAARCTILQGSIIGPGVVVSACSIVK